jgi:hypothetical protein
MLPENKALFDRLGITHWHEGGYDGSLGLTMTFERFPITPNMHGKVERLFEDEYPFTDNWEDYFHIHGYYTAMMHLEAAPGRKIVQVASNYCKSKDGTISGFIVDKLLPWMLENKPDTGYRSLDNTMSGMDSVFGQVADFCTLSNAAGNNAERDYIDIIRDNAWLGIGSVRYDGTNFIPMGYSSISEYVDFAAVGELYAPTLGGQASFQSGTSFACPLHDAMEALVNHFFIKHIGRSLSQAEMIEFVKANSKDVYIEGKDIKTGWGVFVLPPYESIDLVSTRR